MAVPTRRQVIKREKIKETFGKADKPKIEEKPIDEDEHNKRVELLKKLGLLKEE